MTESKPTFFARLHNFVENKRKQLRRIEAEKLLDEKKQLLKELELKKEKERLEKELKAIIEEQRKIKFVNQEYVSDSVLNSIINIFYHNPTDKVETIKFVIDYSADKQKNHKPTYNPDKKEIEIDLDFIINIIIPDPDDDHSGFKDGYMMAEFDEWNPPNTSIRYYFYISIIRLICDVLKKIKVRNEKVNFHGLVCDAPLVLCEPYVGHEIVKRLIEGINKNCKWASCEMYWPNNPILIREPPIYGFHECFRFFKRQNQIGLLNAIDEFKRSREVKAENKYYEKELRNEGSDILEKYKYELSRIKNFKPLPDRTYSNHCWNCGANIDDRYCKADPGYGYICNECGSSLRGYWKS